MENVRRAFRKFIEIIETQTFNLQIDRYRDKTRYRGTDRALIIDIKSKVSRARYTIFNDFT